MLGFTGAEDVGQEGIELAYQGSLAGKPGSRRVIKDRLGRIVEDLESIRESQEGKDVALALDCAACRTSRSASSRRPSKRTRAKAGGIVVLDATTGEVLALANLPTYNPNNRAKLVGAQLRNRAVTDEFEPGSTLKPFTIGLALDQGKVTPTTIIQTAPGSAHHRPGDHPRRASGRRDDGRAGDPEVVATSARPRSRSACSPR